MPTYYIFLQTSGPIQLIGGDSRYHDHHQEDQDDQESPPSTRTFFMTLFDAYHNNAVGYLTI